MDGFDEILAETGDRLRGLYGRRRAACAELRAVSAGWSRIVDVENPGAADVIVDDQMTVPIPHEPAPEGLVMAVFLSVPGYLHGQVRVGEVVRMVVDEFERARQQGVVRAATQTEIEAEIEALPGWRENLKRLNRARYSWQRGRICKS